MLRVLDKELKDQQEAERVMERRVQGKLGVKVGAESRYAYSSSVEGGLLKGRSESSLERMRPGKSKFLTY